MLCCPRHAGSVLLLPYTKETLDVLSLDPHSMLIQNCIVAIMPIGYHAVVPLFSIRKTSFQASLVKSRALHTTCVFNPILFYVHGGVCCLLTAKKSVWFPWRSWLVEPREVGAEEGEQGLLLFLCLAGRGPHGWFAQQSFQRLHLELGQFPPRVSHGQSLLPSSSREGFCHCPAACGDTAPDWGHRGHVPA